jgi:hypothetical protein
MTTDKTQYHETLVLDRVFANVPPDGALDGCYVALFASDPANQPNETNEISGDGYSPVQVTASGWTQVSAGGPREYENANEVDFGVLDSSSQTTVAGVVLYDAADTSTANALYQDALSGGSTTVDAGDEFKFNGGDITVSED